MIGYRIELSDECMRGDRSHCDDTIYRKNRDGTMEVISPCWCGCHIVAESLKGKDELRGGRVVEMSNFDFNSFEKRQNELKALYKDARIPSEYWEKRRKSRMTQERRRKECSMIAQIAQMEVNGSE